MYSVTLKQPVSTQRISNLKKQITEAEQRGAKTIELIITKSDGGETEAALNFCSFLKQVKCEVIGIATGNVCSAAAMILIACQQRLLKSEKRMLLHPVNLKIPVPKIGRDGRLPKAIFRKALSLQVEFEKLLSDKTKLTQNEIEQIRRGVGVFDAKQALECGLIDKIY